MSETASAKEVATVRDSTNEQQRDAVESAPYNLFRDSPLRYMGYTNEIGESFRYQFPRLVIPSYVLAFGYCTMDAATTGYQTWLSSPDTKAGERSREMKTAVATFDTLLWQSLASVMIPGATINMIVKASRFAVARASLPVTVTKWLPTCMGLGSIPFIVRPIDDAVDSLLDNSTRPVLEKDFDWEEWLSESTSTTTASFADTSRDTKKPRAAK